MVKSLAAPPKVCVFGQISYPPSNVVFLAMKGDETITNDYLEQFSRRLNEMLNGNLCCRAPGWHLAHGCHSADLIPRQLLTIGHTPAWPGNPPIVLEVSFALLDSVLQHVDKDHSRREN